MLHDVEVGPHGTGLPASSTFAEKNH